MSAAEPRPARLKAPLIRALLRLDTLWGALILLGMTHTLFVLVKAFGGVPPFLHPGRSRGDEYSSVGLASLVVLLFGAGLGMLTTHAMLELMTCPFTWVARGFRRLVRRDLALLLLAPLLAAAAVAASAGAGFAWGLLGVPLVGASLGMVIFDHRHRGWLRALVALTLILLAPAADLLVALALELPPVLPLLGLLGVVANARWSLSARVRRSTIAGGEVALGNILRHPFAPQPWERRLRQDTLADARWSAGRVADTSSWRAAIDFERWGWSRGTWPLGLLGPAGATLLGFLVLAFAMGLREGLGGSELVGYPFALLWNNELLHVQPENMVELLLGRQINTGLELMVLPGFVFLGLLTVGDRLQPALRPGHLYALSRRARADLNWSAALAGWRRVFLHMAIALGATGLVLGLVSGAEFHGGPPYWLTCLALSAALHPILQLSAGLRELFPGERLAPWRALSAMIFLAFLHVALLFGAAIGLDEAPTSGQWLAVAGCLPLVLLGQLALRAFLRARLMRMDLC